MYRLNKYIFPSVGLAIFIILAYYPLIVDRVFFACDMLDCWLPWRTFASSQFKHLSWPLWNPYQACGMPVYGDLQGPIFNPFFILQSFLFTNSIDSITPSFLSCIFIGALGIYMLSGHFNLKIKLRILLCLAYAGSGFFYAHSQHFYAVISAAWIPWQFFFYSRFLIKPNLQNSCGFLITTFFTTTAGNPGFTIISIWIFFFTTALRIIYIYLYHEIKVLQQLMLSLFFLMSSLVLSNLIIIISAIQIIPFISRHNGLDLHHAAQNPSTPQSWISFIFPYPSWIPKFANETDITMKNYFSGAGIFVIAIGIICFKIIIQYYKSNSFKNHKEKNTCNKGLIPDYKSLLKLTWISLGFVFIMASLGERSLVFSLFYYLMPGAAWFRFPAYYTYFLFILWIIPAFSYLNDFSPTKKSLTIILTLYTVILILLYLWLKYFPSGFSASIPILLILNLAGFSGLMIYIYFRNNSWNRIGLLLFLIDLVFTVRYGINYTLAGKYTKKEIKTELINAPDLSGKSTHLINIKDQNPYFTTLWRNTNVFVKRISPDYFNSFEPDSFVKLVSFYPDISNKILNAPLAHLENSKNSVSYHFNSNSFEFNFIIQQSDSLVILQNYHPFWNAFNNDKKIKIYPFYSFIKIPVNKGKNLITLRFSPPLFTPAIIVSYVVFFVAAFIFIIGLIQKKPTQSIPISCL